jgi:membrane fusion protein, multidrug efflux system
MKWVLILLIFLTGCSSGESEKPAIVSVPVTTSTAVEKNVPIELRAIGNVQAYNMVAVKSMVNGEISQVHFTEGQDVKKGKLLFTIDPRPLEALLKQAEANLARNIAQVAQVEADLAKNLALVKQAEANIERDVAHAENAKVEAKRYESLIERQVVSRQQYDQFRTNAETLGATVRADTAAKESAEAAVRSSRAALENARAAVRADQAAVENAKVQLGYCFISSPMDGRTGTLFVQQGNVIKANDLSLVAINQVSPIYVAFSVPEQNLAEIKKYMAGGPLKVEALPPNDTKGPEQGILTFTDNAVDKTTGTILLKGTFANKERRLWPGQFVNVALTLTVESGVVVVPSQAIQTGQKGQYVYVIKPDLTVESRPVVPGRTINGETAVFKGLKADEKIVSDGQIRLYPGVKVEIKNPDSATTPNKKTP